MFYNYNTLEPLYKTVCYKMVCYKTVCYKMVCYKTVSDIRQFEGGPKSIVSKQKHIDYIEKCPFMVFFFLYNLYFFVIYGHFSI